MSSLLFVSYTEVCPSICKDKAPEFPRRLADSEASLDSALTRVNLLANSGSLSIKISGYLSTKKGSESYDYIVAA